MSRTRQQVRLAGVPLEENCHICAFFNTPDELYRVLAPFIQEGLAEGDKAFHIIDPESHERHLQHLEAAGISAGEALQRGQLEVRTWYETYLRDGSFDPDTMLALVQDVLNQGREQGYTRTRPIANMEWALGDWPGVQGLIEYEARLNHVLPHFGDPVICTYDCSRFGADVVVDMLRTHPMVLIGGMLHKNPYYVPPDDFLEELKHRPSRQAVA